MCGCGSKLDGDTSSAAPVVGGSVESTVSENQSSDTVTGTSSVESTVSNNTSSDTQSSSVSSTNSTVSQETPVVSEPTTSVPDEDEMEYFHYQSLGTVIDYFTENDLIYIVFKTPNRVVILDSNSGGIVKEAYLPGTPNEIKKIENELWIAIGELKQILKYNIATLECEGKMDLPDTVGSFDIYKDYLIYATCDNSRAAYRYNLKTGQKERFWATYLSENVDVLVNREQGIVYISDWNTTGSKVRCFNIENMTEDSMYPGAVNGYLNRQGRAILYKGSLYWGEFKLNALDVSIVEAKYTGRWSAGMLYVDDELVITNRGMFSAETQEQIESFADRFGVTAAVITKSGNLLFADDSGLYILFNWDK